MSFFDVFSGAPYGSDFLILTKEIIKKVPKRSAKKYKLLKLGKSKDILKYIYLSQTVDKVGAGSYPQHHFSVNSLCFNKNLKKLQDSFILDSLISKIFASFFKFIHANVSPAFISIRAFPMY